MRIFKFYSNIAFKVRSGKCFFVIIDTGSGSSLKRLDDITQLMQRKIGKLDEPLNIRNESGKDVTMFANINLMLQIGKSRELVILIVADWLAASVIIWSHFCYRHVKSIRPHLTIVEMEDWSKVPIVGQPFKTNTSLPIQEKQRFSSMKNRYSCKIKTPKRVLLKPVTQTWIEVITKREYTMIVDHYETLLTKPMCLSCSDIADIQNDLW